MRKNFKYILVVVGLAVLSLMLMDFSNRINELGRLSEQHQQVGVQVTQLNATSVLLQTEIAAATSVAAVQERAFEQEKLAGPGQVLIVPLPDGEVTPEPTPTPQVESVSYENWQYWYVLFFGDRP
jgi:hypothetical protein